jgi:hypothetical protein
MELNGPLVAERRGVAGRRGDAGHRGDALHYHLLPRDGLVARIAYLTSGWTTPQSADAIERQATVPELHTDEDTDSFVHGPTIAAPGAPHPRGRSTRHASESAA